jgi:hypothetical protein
MRRSSLAFLVAAVVAWPAAAGAQQVRAGAEFRANTYTTGKQRRPDVHIKRNGDFVVTWTGFNATLDSSGYGVFGQRYDVTGAPVGAEFRINTTTQDYQFRPVAASDKAGNFVVVWSSYLQDGDAYGVFAQRFAANGTAVGAEFQVNSYTTGGQGASYYFVEQNHQVAMAPNGNFVVVWGSYGPGQDGSLSSVHGQRFDRNGARLGGEFQINTRTTGYQFSPSVDIRPDSSFVVAWTTLDSATAGDYGIVAQRFNGSGVKIGGEFQVPSTTTGSQQSPFVRTRPTGEFVVTWTDEGGTQDMFARRFDAIGAPVGAQFQVNTTPGGPGNTYAYSFGMDLRGNFVVNWNAHPDGYGAGIGGQRFLSAGTRRGAEFVVNAYTTNEQAEAAVVSDEFGNVLSAWTDFGRDGSVTGVFAQRFGGLRPNALDVDSTGNRVIEPGETAEVRPTWRNVNGAAQAFGGTLAGFSGPAGGTYTITDPTASYGTVANNTPAPCTDCYAVTVSGTPRPVLHWDTSAVETITPDAQGQVKEWVLHVGASFTDVPTSSPFYRFIETLLHYDVTGGCTASAYCPTADTTREQMAVFVLVAKEGSAFVPPPCGTPMFNDVPASSPFCRFIEELARRGVVSGCGGGNYCPTAPVTREQMSVFVLVTLDPTLNPPACGTPTFNDVPASSPFCRWIEELARRGVVTGCGGGNYCPTAAVTREQMGVFISVTFGLILYGL